MLFSIIVPVYNMEKYLTKCLKSIHSQTFEDFEVIVVDDGSTDQSKKIIADFATLDPRFKTITQKNSGLGAARNTGMNAASGEYLFFIDSDDYIHSDSLKTLANHIRETHSDIYVFGYNLVFDNYPIIPAVWSTYNETDAEKNRHRLLQLNPSVCNKIFRHSLFRDCELKFPEGISYEDMAITRKLFLQAERVTCFTEYLYFYYQRQGSIMHRCPDFKSMKAACEDLDLYFKHHDPQGEYRRDIEKILVCNMLMILNLSFGNHLRASEFCNVGEFLKDRLPEYLTNNYITKTERIQLRLLRKTSEPGREINNLLLGLAKKFSEIVIRRKQND